MPLLIDRRAVMTNVQQSPLFANANTLQQVCILLCIYGIVPCNTQVNMAKSREHSRVLELWVLSWSCSLPTSVPVLWLVLLLFLVLYSRSKSEVRAPSGGSTPVAVPSYWVLLASWLTRSDVGSALLSCTKNSSRIPFIRFEIPLQ